MWGSPTNLCDVCLRAIGLLDLERLVPLIDELQLVLAQLVTKGVHVVRHDPIIRIEYEVQLPPMSCCDTVMACGDGGELLGCKHSTG